MARRTQIEETLTGQGELYDQETLVARVQYRLFVLQDYNDTSTLNQRSERPGLADCRGTLLVEDAWLDPGSYTLVMDDGSTRGIIVTEVREQRCTFQCSGQSE